METRSDPIGPMMGVCNNTFVIFSCNLQQININAITIYTNHLCWSLIFRLKLPGEGEDIFLRTLGLSSEV